MPNPRTQPVYVRLVWVWLFARGMKLSSLMVLGICSAENGTTSFFLYTLKTHMFNRYCNMDYIALSALRSTKLRQIFFSYDIACQWSIHFMERMRQMPFCLHLPDEIAIAWGIPKCHCRGHKIECQVVFSMNVQDGVGRTCGEGIERTWPKLNNAAPSTKEMLPGSRHDTLDRQIGTHNWEKLVDLGTQSLVY